jgi:RHS repeat-associated protein
LWSSNPNTVYTPGFGHRSNGINSFYQVDWLGSTRYVTDVTGSTVLAAQSYDAWGNVDAQAPGSPNHPTDLMFAGGWGYQTEWSNGASEPGLGLDYLQQRYYDPVIGRFVSPDPAAFASGTNLYLYGENDPVNAVDPLGLTSLLNLPVNVAAALRAGDIEYAAFLLGEAGLSRAALLQATRLFIQNPTVQRLLQPAFQGMWRLGSANLPPCDVVGNRVLYALNSAGVEGVKLYLIENPAGLQLTRPTAKFGYHYFVEVGDTVIDSITGPAGQSFNNWVQRFGPAAQQLLRSGQFQDVTQKVVDWQIRGLPGFSSH